MSKRQDATQVAENENTEAKLAEQEAQQATEQAKAEEEARAAAEAKEALEAEQAKAKKEQKEAEEKPARPDVADNGSLDVDTLVEGGVPDAKAPAKKASEIKESRIEEKQTKETETKESEVKVNEPEVKELPNALQLQQAAPKPLSQAFNADELLASLSPLGQTVFYQVREYMDAMMPGKAIDVDTGVRNQVKLYRALDLVFNRLDDNDFKKFYPALLYLFHEYGDEANGVFGMPYVYRFPEFITLSAPERDAFNRFLNMMIVTANPANRTEAVKSLNWKYTLEQGLTEDARTRLQSFYGV